MVQMFMGVLKRCFDVTDTKGKQNTEDRNSTKNEFSLSSWFVPVFKSVSLLCNSQPSLRYRQRHEL